MILKYIFKNKNKNKDVKMKEKSIKKDNLHKTFERNKIQIAVFLLYRNAWDTLNPQGAEEGCRQVV